MSKLLSIFFTTVLVLTLSLTGCADAPDAAGDQSPTRESQIDPHLFLLDVDAPFAAIDREDGSLLLGKGWDTPSDCGTPPDPEASRCTSAWVIGRDAEILVNTPSGDTFDLYLKIRPFEWSRRETQTLSLRIQSADGHRKEIALEHLRPDWQEMRLELPASALQRRDVWNRILLRFAWAHSPHEMDLSEDLRELAAEVLFLALVPRDLDDPIARREGTLYDPEAGRLRIPMGARAAFPVPGESSIEMRLGEIDAGGCTACALEVSLRDRTGTRTISRVDSLDDAAGRMLEIRTESAGAHTLELRAIGKEPSARATRPMEIGLPPDFLHIGKNSSTPDDKARPHIFLYVIDTLRADALEPYGGPSTPRFRAFADDAVTYLDAWSPSAWTLPAVASILTGVAPDRHRLSLGRHRLRANVFPPLAERLSEHGYATVAISQSSVFSDLFRLDAGYETFLLAERLNSPGQHSHDARRALLQWLLGPWNPAKPIFAHLHTVAPHDPYTPRPADVLPPDGEPLSPEIYQPAHFVADKLGERLLAEDPREIARLRAQYEGEILYADREFGHFLDLLHRLELYDESLIIVTSDHGEEFGEHHGFGHGRTLYEEMLRVPLMVKFPGSRDAGRQVERSVSTLDIFPTVLTWADALNTRSSSTARV